MNYLLHLGIYLEIYVLVAVSLNLLVGYAGILHIAHAAYFGVGAYTAALLAMRADWPFVPAMLAGAAIAAAASLLVSLPARRLRGHSFVMMSLAVQIALFAAMYNWVGLTRGPYGLPGIPSPVIFGYNLDTMNVVFVTYGAIVLIVLGLLYALQHSPFGLALKAVRDDEQAAMSVGLAPARLRLQVFAIASAIVAIAGAQYAFYVGFIDPTSFSLDESILMLSMVIVGGTGNFRGPLIGAAVLIALPEALRFLALPDAIAANVRLLAYGLLLVVMMHVRPQGLAGSYRYE